MTDLLSLRIPLLLAQGQDLDSRPIPKWWGEAAHQLSIKVIASRDEALAKELEASKAMKPFTVSNLRGRFPGGKIDPATAYKLRFTALDKRTAEIFTAARSSGILREGETVELDFIRFKVPEVEAHIPIEMDGATYQSLTNILFAPVPPPRTLTLDFFSPTLFKKGPEQVPYPMPELVFGSLLDHWNASPFVPTKLPEEARKYARECLRVGRFRLESRTLKMYGETFRGFVGRVKFVTLNYDRYWMGIMTMLAQYAAYSGVGAKTTMGLGQCALLPETTLIKT
ncbi:MAG: CRISPR-associated endoribonuclease Cas6 [Anaerolineales bacterium]